MRTTIQLDAALAARARRFVRARGLNRFINEAVAEKVEALERAELEALMKEGYLATQSESDELSADWEIVDLEDWPDA